MRWLSDDEQRAWRSFVAVRNGLDRTLERHLQRETGLSMADYVVLVQLSEAPDRQARHHELGRAIGWEKSRLSHHLTRMAQRGLVERAACPQDNRGGFVVLTEAGAAAIAAAAPRHVAHVRHFFVDRLDAGLLDALLRIGAAVLDGLDDELPPA